MSVLRHGPTLLFLLGACGPLTPPVTPSRDGGSHLGGGGGTGGGNPSGGGGGSTNGGGGGSASGGSNGGGGGGAMRGHPILVSTGSNHACTVLDDRSVYCWGSAVGAGSPDGGRGIRHLEGLSARDLSAAEDFTCAVVEGGGVRCWGNNFFGELGDNSMVASVTPVVAAIPEPLVSVSAFHYHACGRTGGGEVICWGQSGSGECGAMTTSVRIPAKMPGVDSVASISSGRGSTWGVLNDGGLLVWGFDLMATLGPTPRPFPLSDGASALDANLTHACALLREGQVECWGATKDGVLGFDAGRELRHQGRVSGLTNATGVCVGSSHSCARLTDGGVSCWGDNTYGQLGTGNYAPSGIPVAVDSLPASRALSCGSRFTCALTIQGIYCWGDNAAWQLGSPSPPGTNRPVRVPFP